MAKNTVKVESLRGNLRLRWSCQGERYCLSLGLYDSPLARTVAEGKASIIEADLTTGNFDVTLTKYQGKVTDDRPLDNGFTVAALFGQFFQHKGRKLTGNTHARYKALDRKIAKHFGAVAVAAVDEEGADRLRYQIIVWVSTTTELIANLLAESFTTFLCADRGGLVHRDRCCDRPINL
jgi:integrase